MSFLEQARGRPTSSLWATWCPRAPRWWPLMQGRIFIFGALGCFKLEAHLEGSRRLMSYKSALHVLVISTEQLVPTHKCIKVLYSEFPPYQEPEPRQPPSIPPIGVPRCHMGSKIQCLPPKIKICNTRNQRSFCRSASFSVLKFLDGASPATVTSNNIAWSEQALHFGKRGGCLARALGQRGRQKRVKKYTTMRFWKQGL